MDMTPSDIALTLPTHAGGLEPFAMSTPHGFSLKQDGSWNRVAFAAAHVVADPLADVSPTLEAAVDWDKTMAFRHRLWSLGFGVAEAMDTAQRGMGMDWPLALELIKRSVADAKTVEGAVVASGAGTDQLEPAQARSLADVVSAYEEQIEAIEAIDGQIILMASRALAKVARSADDYAEVYQRILSQVRQPVIIHWLGDMFDPALTGYWGDADLDRASDTAIAIINANAGHIDGIKVSLLDKDREIELRRRLDPKVRMYTGDDFNYAELIEGDARGHSDALLGIFDAIAPAASAALSALGRGDHQRFHEILAPTVALSRHIFKAPTRFYKTGVVFLAYLNGLQDHFTMLGAQQGCRSIAHLAELFRLADRAGLLDDPAQAARRMRDVLAVHGIKG
jgi:hypothetical protein